MAFNKNKIIALAQKYVQKGQIDRAIKEYQKILDVDRKDIRTRLKIGDLYAKKGDIAEAVRIYQEAAESYTRDGFFLKAVAVYKNILKLDPNLIEINLKLGDLYHQLSLLVDAMGQYQIVVNYYDRNGMVKEALDTLKKMVELDPENLTFKIKLAELYHKEGHVEQGNAEFDNIAQELKESKKDEDLLKVYERILHHQPERLDVIGNLARLYLDMRHPQKALAKLQVAFKASSKDPGTLALLAEAFSALQQPKKAKSVYRELIVVYENQGDQEKKTEICQEILKIDPDDVEVKAMMGSAPVDAGLAEGMATEAVAGEAVAADPLPDMAPEVTQYDEEVTEFSMHTAGSPLDPVAAQVEAATATPAIDANDLSAGSSPVEEPSSTVPTLRPEEPVMELGDQAIEDDFEDIEEEISKLITEADVYLKYGLNDKAREHFESILAKRPAHLEAREKLKDLLVGLNDVAGAKEHLKELVHFAQKADDAELVKKFQAELGGEVPAAEVPVDLTTEIPAEPPAAEEVSPEPEGDERPAETAAAPMPIDIEADLEAIEPLHEEEESEEIAAPPEDIVDVEMDAAAGTEEGSEDLDLGIEVDLSQEDLEVAALDVSELEISPPEERTEPVAAESAEVDDPGLNAEELEAEDAETEPPQADLEVSEPAVLETPDAPVVALVTEDSAQLADEIPVEVREELDEADFFIQQGLADEAQKIFEDLLSRFAESAAVCDLVNEKAGELPEEERAKLAASGGAVREEIDEPLASTELMEAAAEELAEPLEAGPEAKKDTKETESPEETFDLAAELSEELKDYEEIPDAVSTSSDEQVDFQEVFEEFKKGVSKQLDREDSETHFDLGLAYKEMHLTDDAINEFQVAMADSEKVVEGYTMIGLCFMDKGDYEKAADYFRQGLSWKSVKTHEIIGLNYELGLAQLAQENRAEALLSFNRVVKMDPSFRDVSQKIEEVKAEGGDLGAGATAEAEDEGFDLGESLASEDGDLKPLSGERGAKEKPQEAPLAEISAFETPSEKRVSRKKEQAEPYADVVVAETVNQQTEPVRRKTKNKISYV